MKRVLIVLALAAVCTAATAQVKSISAASSALQKAQADTENPKKSEKVGTWIKYGQALIDAYDAPAGNGWIGASKSEVQLVGGDEKPEGVLQVVINGQAWEKEIYPTRNYYYNAAGQIGMIEVTKPIRENALDDARFAYSFAASLDVKGSKTKDIKTALQSIANKYTEEAYTAYAMAEYMKASQCFEKAALAAETAPLSQIDSNSIFNAGFTAWYGGDIDRAEKFYLRAYEIGYAGEGGETYAKLADIAEKKGDSEKSLAYLEEGFQAYPQSQSILVGLINYYINSKGNTDRLFELLAGAKENEPNNPSLYYVEGNIYKELDRIEEAAASYDKCAEINPSYAYGFIGKGQMYYNLALKYSEESANEMDDAKYKVLLDKFEESLKACIEPFEKAYNLLQEDDVKVAVAEYLKNACFRFRTVDPSYQEMYDKYNAVVAAAQ